MLTRQPHGKVSTGGWSDFELLKEAVSFVGSTSRFLAMDNPEALRRVPSVQLVITLPYILIRPQPD
jgi:hypothetical protein